MNAMDQWVLMVFYGIGAVAGLVACALAVLIGLVFCFQIPWWICRQTAAWIRIAKIVRKAARIRKRWKANSTADRAAVADTVKLIVGNSGNDK